MLRHMIGVLLVLLPATLLAQESHVHVLEPAVIDQRFASLRTKETDRADALRDMFAEAGCTDNAYVEQKVSGWKPRNLICTLPGASSRTILVTAHYDKVKKGEGAIDNWSGAALLPSLYQTLSDRPRQFSYTFILFMGEEAGLVGARYYVGQLTPPQRHAIAADVNIDSVGLTGHINMWASRANKDLRNAALTVAAQLGITLSPVNVETLVRDGTPDTDSHSFVDARIPVIDFHSVTPATMKLLHSAKDVSSAVNPETYYDTCRLLAAFLGYLDSALEP